VSEIRIDPEIANLCRSLTDQEKAQLEEDLVARGCLDSLKLWDGVLLDGHNRHEICHGRGVAYSCETVPGIATREQAFNWVIANQLGRRNLTPEEASYLRGKRYNAEKMSLSEASHKSRQSNVLGGPEIQAGKTAQRLANEFGVSHSTVSEDGAFASAVDTIAQNVGPEAARDIRSGKTKLPKAEIKKIAKKPGDEQKTALESAKKDKKMRAQRREPKPEQRSAPQDLGMFMMWLNAGSMHASRFETGAALRAYADANEVTLREDHIDQTHELLSGLIAARGADRAA
jgi:hypothetical protein